MACYNIVTLNLGHDLRLQVANILVIFMPKKELTFTSQLILSLHAVEEMLLPFISLRELNKRIRYGGDYDSARVVLYKLKRRGLIKYIQYKKDKFIQLTEKGELEALMLKTRLPNKQEVWDGKWRVILFDIPEEANLKRDQFRKMLKSTGFYMFQKSVFISPYALNRDAVDYLNKSQLIKYIRILKVEDIDNDKDLKTLFGLK